MAVDRPRTEESCRRVGGRVPPVVRRRRTCWVVGETWTFRIGSYDSRSMKRGHEHLPIGALDREEPVLQVARVIVLVQAHAVGIPSGQDFGVACEETSVDPEVPIN